MYVLDTNVVSELRKARDGQADQNVIAWAAGIPPASLFLSAITILELEQGVLMIERRDHTQGTVLREWLHMRGTAVVRRPRSADRYRRGAALCAIGCSESAGGAGCPDRGHRVGSRHERRDPERERLRIDGRSDYQSVGELNRVAARHYQRQVEEWRAGIQLLAPAISPSALQTNSMIAATKHRIFAMTFSASGSGSAGKANPKAAQIANTTNIPATA